MKDHETHPPVIHPGQSSGYESKHLSSLLAVTEPNRRPQNGFRKVDGFVVAAFPVVLQPSTRDPFRPIVPEAND